MIKKSIISLKQINSAASVVQDELFKVGLWFEGSKLAETEIYWCALSPLSLIDANGFFTHCVSPMQKILGFELGHIYIPSFVLSQKIWQKRGSIRDVIRHEYAHSLAHRYPKLISKSDFKKTFGGDYFSNDPIKMEKKAFISKYARRMPMEDFAETFMVYVWRNGLIPPTIKNVRLIKKWQYLDRLINLINK
jgi:hypothetical protein